LVLLLWRSTPRPENRSPASHAGWPRALYLFSCGVDRRTIIPRASSSVRRVSSGALVTPRARRSPPFRYARPAPALYGSIPSGSDRRCIGGGRSSLRLKPAAVGERHAEDTRRSSSQGFGGLSGYKTMTGERKRWLAKMVDRKAKAILDGTGQTAAVYMSLADTHFTDEDLDFIVDRACRLGRGESPSSSSFQVPVPESAPALQKP